MGFASKLSAYNRTDANRVAPASEPSTCKPRIARPKTHSGRLCSATQATDSTRSGCTANSADTSPTRQRFAAKRPGQAMEHQEHQHGVRHVKPRLTAWYPRGSSGRRGSRLKSWWSNISESQVNGCQLDACPVVNAHFHTVERQPGMDLRIERHVVRVVQGNKSAGQHRKNAAVVKTTSKTTTSISCPLAKTGCNRSDSAWFSCALSSRKQTAGQRKDVANIRRETPCCETDWVQL